MCARAHSPLYLGIRNATRHLRTKRSYSLTKTQAAACVAALVMKISSSAPVFALDERRSSRVSYYESLPKCAHR